MRPLLHDYLVTADGGHYVDFNRMISMNSTAAFLWNKVMGTDFDAGKLVSLLTEEYDVTEEVAASDVDTLIKAWKEAGLVED